MRHPFVVAAAMAALVLAGASDPCSARGAARAWPGGSDARSGPLAALVLPLRAISLPWTGRASRTAAFRTLGAERTMTSFEVGEPVVALFLEVRGHVELERVEIGFAEGEPLSIDVYGMTRDSGLYELTAFEGARVVTSVRLVGRGHRRAARVAVRLGV
jgi:hypothetical protein